MGNLLLAVLNSAFPALSPIIDPLLAVVVPVTIAFVLGLSLEDAVGIWVSGRREGVESRTLIIEIVTAVIDNLISSGTLNGNSEAQRG